MLSHENGGERNTKFLSYLARERKVAASTQNQALNALVFLYKQVLKKDLGVFSHFERAKKSSRLPLVLTRREIAKLLPFMNMEFQLMVELLYGAGLRLMECLRLRWAGNTHTLSGIALPRICWETATISGLFRSFWGTKMFQTTMIYTHVLNKGVMGVKSPLDGMKV
jgi:hypothetical protein